MALNPRYSLFTCILQSIDLKHAAYRNVACASARRSNGMRRTKLKSSSFMLRRALLPECQSQGLSIFQRKPNERLRQKAKVKARKLRGVRRTPVRRSDEQRRLTSFTKYYRAIAQNAQGQGVQAWRSEAYIKVRRSDDMRRTAQKLGILRNRSGFSYLGVLILVAVMSISLIGTGRYWSTIVRRELEAELLYRGDRIREAIASYYNNPPGGQNKTYPRQFSDLLKDPRYPNIKRHLRKWYTDPMNRGKDWVYIFDASQRLKGVHSANEGTPLKTGNFPKDYREFEQAQTYADWTFVFVPKQ